nr:MULTISPECIES: ABC transporter permease subunit [unclassified Cupriavidus]
MIDAARDLVASPWQAIRYVMLPLILPGIIAGSLLAFTLWMDDFVVTFFTAGPGQPTLPLQIYSMIRIAVTPEVNAISSILMVLTLAVQESNIGLMQAFEKMDCGDFKVVTYTAWWVRRVGNDRLPYPKRPVHDGCA